MQWGGPDKEVPSPFWVCLFFFFFSKQHISSPQRFLLHWAGLRVCCELCFVCFVYCEAVSFLWGAIPSVSLDRRSRILQGAWKSALSAHLAALFPHSGFVYLFYFFPRAAQTESKSTFIAHYDCENGVLFQKVERNILEAQGRVCVGGWVCARAHIRVLVFGCMCVGKYESQVLFLLLSLFGFLFVCFF